MATKRRSKVSSERQNWNRILKIAAKMLQSQQTQLELAAKERKILEDRFRTLHDQWLFDVRLSQDQIAEVKGDLLVQEMEAFFKAAKSEMVFGLKQREASVGQLELEYAKSDLEDFKSLLKLLPDKSLNPKDASRDIDTGTKNVKQHPEKLESEVRRLRQENEKLAAEKNSEVSALLAEKKFVWNQYKILEKDCAKKLKSKSAEVEQAEEKVQVLIARMEQFQSSDGGKDGKISSLSSQLTEMKKESNKLKEATYRLREELDILRKSRSDSVTPALKHCTNRTRNSNLQGKKSDKNIGGILLRKESSSVQASDSAEDVEKGARRSKRKRDDLASTSASPKLFSSAFKVPKLKNSASVVRL